MLLQFLITTILVYIFGELIGYAVHWVFHQPWSGRLYRAHKAHHEVLYPSKDFLSNDTYRYAGADSTTPYFTVLVVAAVLPIFISLWYFDAPLWMVITVAIEGILIGVVNNWVHDVLHIRGHFLERFRAFRRWRIAHRIHHANVRFNLGITAFLWDWLFGTFKKPNVNRY